MIKKVLAVLFVVLMVGVMISCNTYQRCPAYSQASEIQTELPKA